MASVAGQDLFDRLLKKVDQKIAEALRGYKPRMDTVEGVLSTDHGGTGGGTGAKGDKGDKGDPGDPGADGTGFTLPSPGGGALLVSFVSDTYVWAYPMFGDGEWLTGDDGEPLYVEA